MGVRAEESLNRALGLEREFDFKEAKKIYEDLNLNDIPDTLTEVVNFRLEDMESLIA